MADQKIEIGPALSSELIRLAVAYNDALDRCTVTNGSNIDEVMGFFTDDRSEEHTSELQSRTNLVCRLLLEKKKKKKNDKKTQKKNKQKQQKTNSLQPCTSSYRHSLHL